MSINGKETENYYDGVSIFQPISRPIIRSVDSAKVSKLIHYLKIYEIEVKANEKKVDDLTTVILWAFVDTGLLRRMKFLGKVKNMASNVSVTELTDILETGVNN